MLIQLIPESVLSLDFGGTQIRTAVAYSDGSIRGRRASRTPRLADDIVDRAVAQLRDSLAEAAPERSEPHDIAISAPGPLDPWRGIILTPPNLDPTLWNFPFATRIGRALGMPAVMERDTQVAVLVEGQFGAAQGERDYVYMTVSTGVGAGVVSDGRLLRGSQGMAGELGHLTVDMNGPPCGCGMPGHLESYSSGTGIAHRAAEAGLVTADGRAAEARDVAALEEAGNETARHIMADARRAFAVSIVSIVDVFNPRVIVVGGGIALGQGDRLLEPAREALRQSGYSHQATNVRLVPAGLGDDVGLVGGLSLVALAHLGDHYRDTS